jgi:hypothetical protein
MKYFLHVLYTGIFYISPIAGRIMSSLRAGDAFGPRLVNVMEIWFAEFCFSVFLEIARDILFAVTKLFGTGSRVPFLAAITSRYRKLMGSITERVISGSNSNSPNNTG